MIEQAATVQLVVRSYNQMIGLARYTESLCWALNKVGITYSVATPRHPWWLKLGQKAALPLGFDLATFFTTYPLSVEPLAANTVTHLTVQEMAFLLRLNRYISPSVVTVHDIIPFVVRLDPAQNTYRHMFESVFDSFAMAGMRRADLLIAVSQFTKNAVIASLGVPSEKIRVVYEGVQHNIFRPCTVSPEFYLHYELDPNLRYILYVGSENPRKNLPRLLQAFQRIWRTIPDVRLLKIGGRQYASQADQLRRQISDLQLDQAVILLEHVPDEDLASFYSLAEVFVFPSLMEGFGLPPLEAMACGTPVVCSSATSLPEVVGEAALLVDPTDVDAIASAVLRVLSDPVLASDLRSRGVARAAQFTWERTARETVAVYEQVLARRK